MFKKKNIGEKSWQVKKCKPLNISTMLFLVPQLCLTLCDHMDCSPSDSSVHRDAPGKNTGVGHHALLQGIFPTQGSNTGLPHCRRIHYCLSHQGSPIPVLATYNFWCLVNIPIDIIIFKPHNYPIRWVLLLSTFY